MSYLSSLCTTFNIALILLSLCYNFTDRLVLMWEVSTWIQDQQQKQSFCA